MLQAKTNEQRNHIRSLFEEDSVLISEDGMRLSDGFITFETMAEIVAYLQNDAPNKELFERCWVAYNRKGSKKKAIEQWKKLSDRERESILPHIEAYVASRDISYQKDFERYLRDKIFNEVVYNKNTVVYDPTDATSLFAESTSTHQQSVTDDKLVINGQQYR